MSFSNHLASPIALQFYIVLIDVFYLMSIMKLLLVVCCAAVLSLVWCKDYYQVLGIPRSSSAREIKVAYRRLAKKW